jgi:hypothetical protein
MGKGSMRDRDDEEREEREGKCSGQERDAAIALPARPVLRPDMQALEFHR